MRNCKEIREVAFMEVANVGVKTRTRALTMAAAVSSESVKRRKVGDGELKISSSVVHVRSRHRAVARPENCVSPVTGGNSSEGRSISTGQCSSTSSDQVTASCCSSNDESIDLAKERFNVVDLIKDDADRVEKSTRDFDRERREATPTSELQAESVELESTARPSSARLSSADSRRRSSADQKTPSESELEEFFSAAEKDLQKRFTEKYNYDIVKDVPLEGGYEWVRLKPCGRRN